MKGYKANPKPKKQRFGTGKPGYSGHGSVTKAQYNKANTKIKKVWAQITTMMILKTQ